MYFQSGGGRYNVQTGRRDGLISLAANVDLPAPSISVPDSVAAFARKGLNMTDMVHLLGNLVLKKYNSSVFFSLNILVLKFLPYCLMM